jgi:hypothetical protein
MHFAFKWKWLELFHLGLYRQWFLLTLRANETFVMFLLWNVVCWLQYINVAFVHPVAQQDVCFGMKPNCCFRGAMWRWRSGGNVPLHKDFNILIIKKLHGYKSNVHSIEANRPKIWLWIRYLSERNVRKIFDEHCLKFNSNPVTRATITSFRRNVLLDLVRGF